MYVVELVAADTVNTMPEATLKATADHGEFRGDTIHGTYDASRQVFAELEKLGISYDDVVHVLEVEGVENSRHRGMNCWTRSERIWGSEFR